MRVGLTEERKGIAEMEKKHQNNLGMRKELQMAKKKTFENRYKHKMSKNLFGEVDVHVD